MSYPDVGISPEFLFFLFLLAAGTLLLARTQAERHFVVFMLRTKRLLKFIDVLASFKPALWRFTADLAIITSFSGLGAAYLSKQGREGRNLDIIILFIGSAAILAWTKDLVLGSLMVAALLLGVMSLSRIKNPAADFVVVSVLISAAFIKSVSWYLAVGEGVFGLLAIVVGALVEHALAITSGQTATPGVSPILPWIDGGKWGFIIPGLGIFVPIIEGVIAFLVLLIVHEFSHGILARVHKISLKSTGLLTLGPIPIGAFVEPDEEEMEKSKSLAKMRVLSMGSFSNLILAIVSLLLFVLLIAPSNGFVVASSNSTIIENGTIIQSIGDINLSDVDHFSAMVDANLFSNRFYTLKNSTFENETLVNVTTDKGFFQATPEELYGLKLKYAPEYRFDGQFLGFDFSAFLVGALFWLYFFNFNVALVNLLPIVPFDGGKMVIELMSMFKLSEETMKNIVYVFLMVGLLIILINAYPLFNMMLAWLF